MSAGEICVDSIGDVLLVPTVGAEGALRPHGHREPYYLLANCRRLLTHTAWRQKENWVIAMELFACGSTSAHAICHEAGIDPYSKKVERTK